MEEVATGLSPLVSAASPGKLILLGEHAVVYGRPALAVPVQAVEARATIWPSTRPLAIHSRIEEEEQVIELAVEVATMPDDPLATAARAALQQAGWQELPEWLIELASSIPVARGLGSSAAVAVAIVRAIGRATGREFDADTTAALAFEAECCTHGTPSGIDNTVVAWERPVRFAGGECTPLTVATPLSLVIGDTGQPAPTREMVAAVGQRRQQRPRTYEQWFDRIASLVGEATAALESGDLIRLGWAMNANHLILQAVRVSSSQLDCLVSAARRAGALGAKLSGAGGGGVMVALVRPEDADPVAHALESAGAHRVIQTTVPATLAS